MTVAQETMFYMAFGVAITIFGAMLAWGARSDPGEATLRAFGSEFSLKAAGGILVMLLGISITTVPLVFGRDIMDYVPKADLLAAQGELALKNKEYNELKDQISNVQKDNLTKYSLSNYVIMGRVFSRPDDVSKNDCASTIFNSLNDDDKGQAVLNGSTIRIGYQDIKAMIWCRDSEIVATVIGAANNVMNQEVTDITTAVQSAYPNIHQ